MIAIAFAAHLLLLGITVIMGEFSVRPDTPAEAYTVEIVDDGELGGHMPAGLPKLDLGGEEPPKRQAAKPPPPPPKQAEPPPPPPQPEPPPEPEEQAEPPPPEPKAPEPPKEEPKPQPALDEKPPQEGDLVVATATPAPTVKPTAKPTAQPTPKPTAKPTPAATASPRPTGKPSPAATASVRPTATPRPSASPIKSPRATAARSPGAAPKPTQSPVVVVKGRPTPPGERAAPGAERSPQASPASDRDAQIAEALARVQRNVGGARADGSSAAPGDAGIRSKNADARGTGGVGGTDAPDPNRRVGIGPGRGGAGELRGVEFLLYYNAMLARIRDKWVYTGGATTAEVKVRFRILDDGAVTEVRVTQPSGDAAYDASVLRAVRGASPLGPPPEKHRADFADVELTFQPGDLKAAP